MTAVRARQPREEERRAGLRQSTLARSLALVVMVGLVIALVSYQLSSYENLELGYGGYYFAALAGLTILIGLSGQVSLGHGALMAVGAYTATLLIANEGWPELPAILAAVAATAVVGLPVGAAASRLSGPYLAGATLAFAVGLPALADQFPTLLGGSNGLVVNPPSLPGFLGPNFSPEQWQAWIACLAALVVLFLLFNLKRSGVGRSMRAVRDDEIAAALCGIPVGRTKTVAFVISAACAGLGGGIFALVVQLAAPGAFQFQLSLDLLAGVVVGGLGSLTGAVWGAALLVLLPGWANDLGGALSLSSNAQNNLPIVIYGVVLIVVMLAWPSGIQGALSRLSYVIPTRRRRR
jgi:branched-chain amino acid transport system permease protein